MVQTQSKFGRWLQVSYRGPQPLLEAFAEFMTRLSGRGVLMGDDAVTGYLEDGPEAAAQWAAIQAWAASPERTGGVLEKSSLAGRDWGQNWKRHFKPFLAVPGLIIAPPWEEPEPAANAAPDAKTLIIDPGMAFGTGQHESTCLCLTRLAHLAQAGPLPGPVLDVGCGTGVLALAALLWGAPRALGIDLDADALEAAHKNAALNNLADRLGLSADPLGQVPGQYPLALANITALDLMDLAPQLKAHLAPGGELILAGVLAIQADEVLAAFQRQGLSLIERRDQGEWSSLVLS